jgi:hypothetical protein
MDISVCVGDIVTNRVSSNENRAHTALVTHIISAEGKGEVCLVHLTLPVGDGAWRGSCSAPLVYGGMNDDELHTYLLSDTWFVSDPMWD